MKHIGDDVYVEIRDDGNIAMHTGTDCIVLKPATIKRLVEYIRSKENATS